MARELRCTYRLQLNKSFDFAAASDLIDYLAQLGISHLYLSPILLAGSTSEHGYDVTDPTQVNSFLGGEDGLLALFRKLAEHDMGAVIDIVPNHMSATPENPWWWSVLREGPRSPHASAFDIDWDSPDPELKNKLLLPMLGDHLGHVISRGEIEVVEESTGPVIKYFDHTLPINQEGVSLVQKGIHDIQDILSVQHYHLAYWRTGSDQINYRRFFDVPTLVGMRIEDASIFQKTHQKLFEIAEVGPVDGFRIDHPDGLRDPAEYFARLRGAVPDFWLLAEKILEPGETLPDEWPIDGTSGYDFLQRVGGLYIDPAGEKPLSDFYTSFTGHSEPYGALVRERKRQVLQLGFGSDLRILVELLRKICLHPSLSLDYARRELQDLLIEVLAGFPVYRTYITPDGKGPTTVDHKVIAEALASARRRIPPIDEDLLDLLNKVLCGEINDVSFSKEFVARFQQLTGPVMAKGVEDTTFYCYDRLLALNEVGCDPAHFGVSVQAFHEACTQAHATWPKAMLSTSTHDTKRSEDVRSRLSVLSEMAPTWAEQVSVWSAHNLSSWSGREPDRNAEHLIYQTLVGAWPIAPERIEQYVQKACREAKIHTSWLQPNEGYELRVLEFLKAILADPDFVEMLERFVDQLIPLGHINALSQTLIKLTAPGVPDIYQGCEMWDYSLVDPDNRRAVDYTARRRLLKDLISGVPVDGIMKRSHEGLPKLYVIYKTLQLRKRLPHAFSGSSDGVYRPLLVSGTKLQHVVAYSRGGTVAVVTPRLVHTLGSNWEETEIHFPSGSWRNVLDDSSHMGAIKAATLFQKFPVALLEKEMP